MEIDSRHPNRADVDQAGDAHQSGTFLYLPLPPYFPLCLLRDLCARQSRAVVYFSGPVTLKIMGSSFWGLGLQSVMQRERGSLRRYRWRPSGREQWCSAVCWRTTCFSFPPSPCWSLAPWLSSTCRLTSICSRFYSWSPRQFRLRRIWTHHCQRGQHHAGGAGLQQRRLVHPALSLRRNRAVTVAPRVDPARRAFLPATYLVGSFQAIMVGGQSLFDHRAEMLPLVIPELSACFSRGNFPLGKRGEDFHARQGHLPGPRITFSGHGGLDELPWKPQGIVGVKVLPLLTRVPAEEEEGSTLTEAKISLDDFDGSDDEATLLKTWQVASESGASMSSVGELEIISSGASESPHALQFSGRIGSAAGFEHAGVIAWRPFKLPADASRLRGIELQVMGISRVFQVRIVPPEPTLPSPALTFVPDSIWQPIRLPAAWMTRPNPFPAGSTLYLELRADGPQGPFDIDVDEIRFY